MSEATADELRAQFHEYTEAAWNNGDVDVLDELFATDVVVHEVAAGETYEGRDEFKRWVRGVRDGFPDFAVDMSETEFIVGEEQVAVRWVVSGTYEGRLPGIDREPTGASFELEGTTVYDLDDGQVTEAWWYYDNLAFLSQLGLVSEELAA